MITVKLSSLLMATAIFCSCNTPPKKSTEPVAIPETVKTNAVNCYGYTNKKDTVLLTTVLVDGIITGTLVYNFYEKDKNKGTIRGQMNGDLLIADYTFNSEGAQSTRQVAFRKKGSSFVEGYGEAVTKNGKDTFKNIDSLNFDHSIILSEVGCEK